MEDSTLTVAAAVVRSIEQEARSASPEECCGLLSGTDGAITNVHPLRNESPKPETRYFASPDDLLAAMRRIRDAGRRMMGIYHSHPRTAAYPSASDVEMAFYPEAVYFIISLESKPDLRAYRIEGGRIRELNLRILE